MISFSREVGIRIGYTWINNRVLRGVLLNVSNGMVCSSHVILNLRISSPKPKKNNYWTPRWIDQVPQSLVSQGAHGISKRDIQAICLSLAMARKIVQCFPSFCPPKNENPWWRAIPSWRNGTKYIELRNDHPCVAVSAYRTRVRFLPSGSWIWAVLKHFFRHGPVRAERFIYFLLGYPPELILKLSYLVLLFPPFFYPCPLFTATRPEFSGLFSREKTPAMRRMRIASLTFGARLEWPSWISLATEPG